MATVDALALPEQQQKILTAAQVRAQVNLIQEVMQGVMKKDVHYGQIPGTPKPTLYKPGAEKLAVTFRMETEPTVEDLSTPDEARFRVYVRVSHAPSPSTGIGEASTAEEKYAWRRALCEEEFESVPEDRKRIKFQKGYQGKVEKVKQIRTNIADVRNTVLKMAHKRALVSAVLLSTAASDIFSQDIEDLPEEIREQVVAEEVKTKPTIAEPQKKAAAAPAPKQEAAPQPEQGTLNPLVPIQGKLVRIVEKETKKGSPYLAVLVGEQWVSVFDKAVFDSFKARLGKQVIVGCEQSGDFFNGLAIENAE